jgi:mRNA interferase MazF
MTGSSARTFKPWDIVVVPFPFSDQPTDKLRPALVVSSPKHMTETGVAYLAMITSADNSSWLGDVAVSNLRGAGLPAPSVVRTAKIMTLNIDRIVRRLGALPKTDQEKVAASVAMLLASPK